MNDKSANKGKKRLQKIAAIILTVFAVLVLFDIALEKGLSDIPLQPRL